MAIECRPWIYGVLGGFLNQVYHPIVRFIHNGEALNFVLHVRCLLGSTIAASSAIHHPGLGGETACGDVRPLENDLNPRHDCGLLSEQTAR